jgi:uncharacterized membrane protein YgcG
LAVSLKNMKSLRKSLAVLVAAIALFMPQLAAADVNDFIFESFDATYYLSVNENAQNRPEMQVTETLVALFPEIDQNRGIKRSLPSSSYGDNPGLIQVQSVTDENGNAREYEVIEEEGFTNLYIKKQDDSFVYGKQTYVIKYSQSWIIRSYKDSTGDDEFYWDVNGTGWQQSFDKVSARVTFDAEIQKHLLLDSVSCYKGASQSQDACDDSQVSKDQILFVANNLGAGENLTIAIPFKAGALNTRGPDVSGSVAWFLFLLDMALLLGVLLWALYFRIYRIRSKGLSPIVVPEYKPAASPSLLESSLVAKKTSHLMQALVVELGVKKHIEIEAVAGNSKDFILRRTSAGQDEDGVLAALGLDKAGAEIVLGSSGDKVVNAKISAELQKLLATKTKQVNSSGYFLKKALGLPAIGFVVAIVLYILWLVVALQLDELTASGYVAAPLLSFFGFSVIYWLLVSKRAYTPKGSAVVSHLKGLEMYIDLAEKDRLEYLQSPKGASLTASEVKGKQVLKLYEEVLPWAILLGLQKQWGKVLTDLYEDQGSPTWFVGTAFMYQSFSDFDQALSSSLATSSEGGSSGGGSSGGGGGGGGGSGL